MLIHTNHITKLTHCMILGWAEYVTFITLTKMVLIAVWRYLNTGKPGKEDYSV
jgi:hypothetical protein